MPGSATTELRVEENSIDRILAMTVECMARSGYEGASTKEIAAAAGVSKSLLHYHFDSKEELMLRAIERLAEEIAADIRQRAPRGATAEQRLRAAAEDLHQLLFADRTRTAFMTVMYATAIHSDRVRERLQRYRARELELIQTTLAEALGVAAQRAPFLSALAGVVQTCMLGVIASAAAGEEEAELRRRWNEIRDLILSILPDTELKKEPDTMRGAGR